MTQDALNHSAFASGFDNAPALQQYEGRDGAKLSYRFYDSSNQETVIFLLHGSSAHGEYLHPLAEFLSAHGIGRVVVPNLRGHFGSGKPGDCAFIGQLEDDLYHFINIFDLQGKSIYLVGHSSGGGLAIRYAGGPFGDEIAGVVLLSPAIPRAPTMRQGNAGGWASVKVAKIIALNFLNALGVTRFNDQKVIRFNKPGELCDGRETLSYSYNLYASYHPPYPYDRYIAAVRSRFLLLVGSRDEAHDHRKFADLMGISTDVRIITGARHLDLVHNTHVWEATADWIKKKEASKISPNK